MSDGGARRSSRAGAGKRERDPEMVGGDTKEIHAALIRLCAYTFVAEVHSSVAAAIASEGHGRLDRRQHEGSVRYQVKKLMPSKPDIMRTKAMPNGAFEDLLQQMREAVGGGLQAGKKTEGDDGLRCASDGPLAWTLMEEHSDEKYDVRPPPNRFGADSTCTRTTHPLLVCHRRRTCGLPWRCTKTR